MHGMKINLNINSALFGIGHRKLQFVFVSLCVWMCVFESGLAHLKYLIMELFSLEDDGNDFITQSSSNNEMMNLSGSFNASNMLQSEGIGSNVMHYLDISDNEFEIPCPQK